MNTAGRRIVVTTGAIALLVIGVATFVAWDKDGVPGEDGEDRDYISQNP